MEAVNSAATTQRPRTIAHVALATHWQQTNTPVWTSMSVRHTPTSAQVNTAFVRDPHPCPGLALLYSLTLPIHE